MTIQSQLNNAAISMLDKTNQAIRNSNEPNRSYMISLALREIMDARPCLDDMTSEQIEIFDNEIIELFEARDYV